MSVTEPKLDAQERLWSRDFFLLWQGQFVSTLGDTVYQIALGFWVLAVTGSTALMGTLMAASMLPSILLSPFAGVLVDRADRKNLLVWMDAIRGILIVLIGISAYLGILKIWMVFAAGVALGICSSFFNPAVNSAMPDIVPHSQLTKANSFFRMIHTSSNIVGNSAGGFIFQFFGAPFLFLFNGLSYLFSAFTEVFIRVPKLEKSVVNRHFLTDLKEGLSFVWNFRGLRYLIFTGALLNFFATMGIFLILPLFQRTEGLGPAKYGILMASMMAGMLGGMIFTSSFDIKPARRIHFFIASSVVDSLCFALFPLTQSFYLMLTLVALAGVANAIINVFFSTMVHLTVPQQMRGKVWGVLHTVLQGLMPLSMGLAGILAEFIPIPRIITFSFLVNLAVFLPFGFLPAFRRFICFDPASQSLEDIL